MDEQDKIYFKFCKIIAMCFFLIIIAIFFVSCTISMNMVSTKGTASDVIDEVQSPQNDLKADISAPISGI